MTDRRDAGARHPPASYLDQDLGGFLASVARREPAPGGGSVAAVTVSLAAALVEMAARYSGDLLADGSHLVDSASGLRARAAELADLDARVYQAVIAAYARTGDQDPAVRRDAIRTALHNASEVPLEIARIGAETAKLAARLVADGKSSLQGDAVTALLLTEAAVRSAARLVSINVEAAGGDPDLVRRAQRSVDVAWNATSGLNSNQREPR
ncbi:MAG: cyclodeaminase/cyclohydrolase family protein [Nocardioidaceae bacterium]